MRISDVIARLDEIRAAEGDLIVTHYSAEKHWEPISEISVHPAGRAHGRRRDVHAEKVVEIGDEF